MRLADSQVALLGEAATLISAYGDLLSAFELELMAEVASRFSRSCRDPEVTPAEWDAIEPAIEAMRAASQGDRQTLARACARQALERACARQALERARAL